MLRLLACPGVATCRAGRAAATASAASGAVQTSSPYLLAFARVVLRLVEQRHLPAETGSALVQRLEAGEAVRSTSAGHLKRAFRSLRNARHAHQVLPQISPLLLAGASAWLGSVPPSSLGWKGHDVRRAVEALRQLAVQGSRPGPAGPMLVHTGHVLLAAATLRGEGRLMGEEGQEVTCALAEALLNAELAARTKPVPGASPAALSARLESCIARLLSAGSARQGGAAEQAWSDEEEEEEEEEDEFYEEGEEDVLIATAAPARLQELRAELQAWQEAVDTRLLSRREAEAQELQRLRAALVATFPGAELLLFGSRAAGLQLPGADADLLLRIPPAAARFGGASASEAARDAAVLALRRAKRLVEQARLAQPMSCLLLPRARVPLLRFRTADGNMACDLCCDSTGQVEGAESSGPAAAEWARERARISPSLRPLLLPLKALVHTAGLGDASQGGLGGHALCNLALFYLRTPAGAAETCPAARLLGFLRLFGHEFEYRSWAVGAEGPLPLPQPWAAAPRMVGGEGAQPLRLHIQDPVRPWMDVGAPAWNVAALRRLFRHAHDQLAEGEKGDKALRRLLGAASQGKGGGPKGGARGLAPQAPRRDWTRGRRATAVRGRA